MNRQDIPRLHLVARIDLVKPTEYIAAAVRSARGGCDAVHLRATGYSGGDVYRMALSVKRELRQFAATRLFINDRLDVALLAGADGAQLGERSFSIADARKLLGADVLLGRSIHDLEGARQAASDGADYVFAGHIFETPSHAGEPGRGLDWLAEITAAVDLPVIAIGGITLERVPEVVAAGAHGVAMGRQLLHADAAEDITRRTLACFETRGNAND